MQTLAVANQEVKPFRLMGGSEADPKITPYELSPDRKGLVFDARDDLGLYVVKIDNLGGEIVTEIATSNLSPLSWSPIGTQQLVPCTMSQNFNARAKDTRTLRFLKFFALNPFWF